MAQIGELSRPAEESTAHLVQRATDQLSTLVRDELALAKLEISTKAARVGRGAGMLGGAGVIALYGLAGLFTAAALGLVAAGLAAWLAALIVGGALLLLGGVAALVGLGQLRKATPPLPTDAVAGVRADVDTLTHAIRRP